MPDSTPRPLASEAERERYAARRRRRYARDFADFRASAEVMVVSFPKCGRTWHRTMLAYYLASAAGADIMETARSKELSFPGFPRVAYDHNAANFSDWLPPDDPIVASPALWEGRRLLLLTRDPRDVLVSAYWHAVHRERCFAGDMGAFVRDPRTGIEKILAAYRRWHENSHLASAFLALTYEQMHADPAGALAASLAFCGVPEPDAKLVEDAASFASFANMRRLEEAGLLGDDLAKALPREGRKVREGRVGSFRDGLSADDLAFVEDAISRLGDPFRAP